MGSSDSDTIDDALLSRLPMFPLPRAALFPGITLPLHLFEPRYRALAAHCVEDPGERVMALAALQPGYEERYRERPPVYPIMGVGRVVAEQQLPDGRWNIALRGIARVELVEEHPPDEPFRVVAVRRLPDIAEAGDRDAAQRLMALIVQVARSVPAVRPQLGQLLSEAQTPGRIADVVAGLFVEGFPARRRFLEERRVATRLTALNDVAAALLLMAERSGDEPLN